MLPINPQQYINISFISFKKSNSLSAACIIACLLLIVPVLVHAQEYDLLLKKGHVIDPKNEISAVMDVAIADGKIARVADNISAQMARRVVDAQGLYVTPGLVDIHTHNFYGVQPFPAAYSNGFWALPPDGFTFRAGVTTVVDVGGAGWREFRLFKEQVIDRSDTRVLAFINIVGSGMQKAHIEQNNNDMDPKMTALVARQYPDIIVGVKIAHYEGHEWGPYDRTVQAAEQAGLPVMIDFGSADPSLSLKTLLLDKLRPGDLFTHTYADTRGRERVVDENGQVKPFVVEAQKKGIIFDVGHGGGSFTWQQAVPAMQQGFWPDVMGTDLHRWSMNAGLKDMANLMSKFLTLGMPLEEVILRSSWNPAKYIGREDLGHLSQGAEADVAVFRVLEGDFGFLDSRRRAIQGNHKLQAELTLRSGRVVWDLNGLAAPQWEANQGD